MRLDLNTHTHTNSLEATKQRESRLTGLNQEELLGLGAHLIRSGAVIAPIVILRLWGNLG